MRKDITIEKLTLGGEKVNKSALARQFGCCWRTIDRRLHPEKYKKDKKKSIISNLTIRFETIKGYQSQVDWKEKMKLYDIKGNEYIISIFLIVLGVNV